MNIGCELPSPDENNKKKPQYPPIVVIVNPIDNSTVYDSTEIKALAFYRGERTLNLYIDNQLKHSVNSDTLLYLWQVKQYPKFSIHNILVVCDDEDTDSLSSYSSSTVTVSYPMIAFSSNRNGNFQIYIINEDGGQLKQVTFQPGEAFNPVWSYAGDKITYINRSGSNKNSIYVYDLMNNSNQLFYEADTNNYIEDLTVSNSNIYKKFAFIEDGNLVTLDSDKNKEVIFSTYHCKNPSFGKNNEMYFEYRVWVKYLAFVDSSKNLYNIIVGTNENKWSFPIQRPGSNSLYLINQETKELKYGTLSGTGYVWQINLNNNCAINVDTTSYSFSPNGKKVVYVKSSDKGLYIVNYNGGTPKLLISGGKNLNPAWSMR